MKVVNFLLKDGFLFGIGGLLYQSIELMYRGYTHWSMYLLGGVCFLLLGYINRFLPWETPLPLQMLLGMAIITILEFFTGLVLNLHLNWHVWDYSNMPLNLLGQISVLSSIGWYFLSAVGIILDDYLRYLLFGEQKPRYCLWFEGGHKKIEK